MNTILSKIHDYALEEIMGDRFARYSKSIIQDRALPDIRDGLKPVQRRILYAMYRDRNTYDKPHKKSATAVGNIMGHYHPHGDSSIYEAMVRMSQWWKQNTPYIDMHGNNGSLDGCGNEFWFANKKRNRQILAWNIDDSIDDGHKVREEYLKEYGENLKQERIVLKLFFEICDILKEEKFELSLYKFKTDNKSKY